MKGNSGINFKGTRRGSVWAALSGSGNGLVTLLWR